MKSTHTSAELSFVSRSSFSFCSFFICCSSSPLDCKKSKKTVSTTGVMSTVTNAINVQYVAHGYSDRHNQCPVQGSCPQCQTKSFSTGAISRVTNTMFSTGAISTVTNTINVQYRGHVHSDKHNVQYRGKHRVKYRGSNKHSVVTNTKTAVTFKTVLSTEAISTVTKC